MTKIPLRMQILKKKNSGMQMVKSSITFEYIFIHVCVLSLTVKTLLVLDIKKNIFILDLFITVLFYYYVIDHFLNMFLIY